MSVNKSLSEALGIPPIEKEEPTQEIIPPESQNIISVSDNGFDRTDQNEDYNKARKTLHSVIDTANTAIKDLAELARETEEPRAYEVLATLIKSVTDATSEMYNIQKKTKDLNKIDNVSKGSGDGLNVERAVFVGSPQELLKKFKENGKV